MKENKSDVTVRETISELHLMQFQNLSSEMEFRIWNSDFQSQIPDSEFRILDSKFRIPDVYRN